MTDLSDKMRLRAEVDTENAPELARLADEFDTAAAGFYAEPQTVSVKSFMGAWARARRAWCAATGESLV